MNHWLRSTVAIVGGAITTMVLVLIATYMSVLVLLPPAPEGVLPYATPTFVVVSLGYSMASAIVGGWVAARLARGRALMHSVGMGILLLIPILRSRGAPGPGQPGWYPWVFGAVVLVGAVAGAVLRERMQ